MLGVLERVFRSHVPLAGAVVSALRRRRSVAPAPKQAPPEVPIAAVEGTVDPRWFPGGCPPRSHSQVVPLVHGDEYFGDLCEALASARERVTICGWCITPLMSLSHPDRETGSLLAKTLNDVSRRAEVYVLLWSGAPAIFEPTSRYVQNVRKVLAATAPRVHCELDHRAPFSHDHHQKAVTVDGRVAYVGGMDLTTYEGDRWDTAQHPLRFGPNWHDVQLRIRGDASRDVQENFCQRWNAVTGDDLRPLPVEEDNSSWSDTAQVVRTVPAGFYPFAKGGEYGIAHAYLSAIPMADRFIYLENQYIWSPEIVDALIEAMNRPRRGPFRIVLVLPADAHEGKYDNDTHVRLLARADAGRGIFHAYSIFASGPAAGPTGYRYLPIYVHAKVAIIDDQWLTAGSANLNGRGLATDTEMNVQAVAPRVARDLRIRLWAEHLGMAPDEIAAADPIDLIDKRWKECARQLLAAQRANGIPPGGHAIPYVPGVNPGSRLLDLMQVHTLEH